MKRALELLIAATALAALPGLAAAQSAATHVRVSSAAHAERRHSMIPQQTQNAVLELGPTLGLQAMQRATGEPPRLRAARSLPLHLSWSATDVTLAAAFTTALLVDHGQTRALARDGWRGWRETNPILGPRPSVGQLDTYAAATGLIVLGTAAAVPARVRPWLLGAAFAVEAFTVAGSMQRGIAVRLP